MSVEQLSAFFEVVQADAVLEEKLKGAADLDAAVAMAQEAGFDVSKADWLKHQAKQTLELSDEELEGAAGGDKNCPILWDFSVFGGQIPGTTLKLGRLSGAALYKLRDWTLYLNSPKAPVSAGAFFFFNIPQRPLIQSPIPGTIIHLRTQY